MFTINDAMHLADSTTFQRGSQYFKAGRVISAKLVDNDTLEAQVKGSARAPYVVRVYRHDGEVVADCTCPVEFDCKHGVAAILQLANDRQTGKLPQHLAVGTGGGKAVTRLSLDQWLSDIEKQTQPVDGPLVAGQHYLLYALAVTRAEVQVHFYKAYLRQDSSWSQIQPFTMDYYTTFATRPRHIRQEDIFILALLNAQRELRSTHLKGREGAMALDHMLDTGRLMLEAPLRQAKAGTALRPAMEWEVSAGVSQLHMHLPGHAEWSVLPVEPPHYLDLASGEVGLLHTDLSAMQLSALRDMPAVPAADMARIGLRLRRHFSSEALPLPREPDIHEERELVPCITLLGVDVAPSLRLPGIRLQWAYGPVLIAPEYASALPGESFVEHAGNSYRVVRDLAGEQAAISRLGSARFCLFRQVGQCNDIWMLDCNAATDALQHWMHWRDTVLPQWQAEGWRVSVDPGYKLNINPVQIDININDAQKGWFEFELALTQGKWRLSTMAVVSHWLESGGENTLYMPDENGDWLEVDLTPLQPVKAFIQELYNQKKLDKPVRLPAFQALSLEEIDSVDSRRAPLTRKMMRELRQYSGLENVALPTGLKAQLRQYQQHGFNWLVFLHRFNLGGILADDMGLGKTMQTLTLILHLKQSGQLKKPALIVCPTSLAGNWRREAEQFTPSLRVLVIHGSQREALFKSIGRHDLVITTYPLLMRDQVRYQKQAFTVIAADEAQTIKNVTTKAAQAIRTLNAQMRVCLTGTPMENHLGELWALMDFALPGLLGGHESFRKLFRQPIENDNDHTRREELARRTAPFMIRRTKAEVVKELPPKTEILQYVTLEGSQRQLYESIRISMEARIREIVKKKGMARSQIEFLDALLKLRQVCIDPRLVKLDSASAVKEHAKLDWLRENVPQMLEEGRRILVFSQFTEALALVEDWLKEEKIPFAKLTGKTRKREEAVEAFQSGEASLFLISLKAGGSGLNLTAADVVIHIDPWWNPAVENQATDRAYRIGQDKPVFVYKLVAEGTIEERIQEMQNRKQALANALFDDAAAAVLPSDAEDLLALLT